MSAREPVMRLTKWERGIKLESISDGNQFAFLWFYEWLLFDAVHHGEHTHGAYDWDWSVEESGAAAHMDSEWLKLHITAEDDGARLALEITNGTERDWPSIAAIIPCLNPGDPKKPTTRNRLFLDESQTHTYFQGKNGLELIMGEFPREIHFNHECSSELASWEKERADGRFVFDEKWPGSERDAYAGIVIRESEDGRYVMGIAWESFLSAQGHNPWNCMHLSIRVGPLARLEKRAVRGKIYLFEGSKADCLRAFERDFAVPRSTEAAPQ